MFFVVQSSKRNVSLLHQLNILIQNICELLKGKEKEIQNLHTAINNNVFI